MKQVRIRVTCDACAAWHETDNDEGVQTVPAAGTQTLDLCPSHRTDLAPFLSLIAEWGASTQRASKRAHQNGVTLPSSAPVAPAEPGSAPNRRGGKRARQRRANASAQPAPTGELTCPLCQHPSASGDALGHHLRLMHSTTTMAVYGDTCPLCGHQGTARGLGSHGGHAHSISGTAALFAAAQQQGDPYGVIASRVAAMAAAAQG